MAIRNIIKIDEVKCNGCGKCIVDCAEGALKLVDGKARLVRDDFCDGLGACIGSCPQGAITFEQRDAPEFDEAAVHKHLAATHSTTAPHGTAPVAAASCPGLQLLNLAAPPADALAAGEAGRAGPSELTHWPIQLALIPPTAPFLRGCDLLFAADCAPLAVPDFHARFLRARKIVLGCPKLDDRESYVGKLAAIVEQADLRSLTIVHMEVPCCMALAQLAQAAFQRAGKQVPTREVTVSRTGQVLSQRDWP